MKGISGKNEKPSAKDLESLSQFFLIVKNYEAMVKALANDGDGW